MTEIPQKEIVVYHKVCAYCKKKFDHTSRKTKFCNPECGKSFAKLKKKRKKEYLKERDSHLISVRAHNLACLVLDVEVKEGRLTKACVGCGVEKDLQVHHKDVNYLNNDPSNLVYFCSSCHAKEHSVIRNESQDQCKEALSGAACEAH